MKCYLKEHEIGTLRGVYFNLRRSGSGREAFACTASTFDDQVRGAVKSPPCLLIVIIATIRCFLSVEQGAWSMESKSDSPLPAPC